MALKQILHNLIDRARRTGEPARTRLPHGLSVAIMVEAQDGGDLVSLQLSRANVYPSAREWKTITQQWPGQYSVVKEPKEIKDSTTYYLKGRLRLVPELVKDRQ